MSSYFNLELDTTGPIISINSPLYAVPTDLVTITITSNEIMAPWQEIYTIDSTGMRRDLVLFFSDNEFTGEFSVAEYGIGVATIYAKVLDDVGNVSPIASKLLVVYLPAPTVLAPKDEEYVNMAAKEKAVDLSSSIIVAPLKEDIIPANLTCKEYIRSMEVMEVCPIK